MDNIEYCIRPRIKNQLWYDEMNIALKLYKDKMIQHIGSLDHGKDLRDFESMQETIGEYGMKLAGDWPPSVQKNLYALWTLGARLYVRLGHKKQLQKVVETQVVQRQYIESVHNLPSNSSIEKVYRDWIHNKLRSHSATILEYIDSLQDESTKIEFQSVEWDVKPYGMNFNLFSHSTEAIKVIQFWARHVHVFLKMKRLGETVELQKTVEKLVRRSFEETSRIMAVFLEEKDGTTFTYERPVLYEFLKYFNAQNHLMNEGIQKVLVEYENKVKFERLKRLNTKDQIC
ncbi:uncharacterized protein MELLADRAFT_66140 [Melampsora larici-populina 98AG31]|uniref:Uncharacterized protein n=1 Tax=Melampsora larici-populina (strain 98AG31 / pathotype 3-4-7) TaxID=747676 RepID=F4RY17_MELLP|nr:uncharacterized protein MELLADRAFT_66140 [Melampsora larici-populina 98AG31]EGG02606.1 hypothetical protein MELLADRAFT_66140 [Melampsora larici-populina 98AG31]